MGCRSSGSRASRSGAREDSTGTERAGPDEARSVNARRARWLLLPALATWRAELAARMRDAFTFDWLWRAACAEMWAAELEGLVPELAASYRRKARQIVRDAAQSAR